MLAIDVTLLTGRYAAASASNRTEPEWPPHPGRLYSALVAAWAEHEQDPAERAALEWLETQDPPHIHASGLRDVARRQVMTHFVPGNDATAIRNVHGLGVTISDAREQVQRAAGDPRAERAATKQLEKVLLKAQRDSAAVTAVRSVSAAQAESALQLLPENRNRQARYYPVIRPRHDRVTFVWPASAPEPSIRNALVQIVERLGRLGHSSCLVSARVADAMPDGDGRLAYVPITPDRSVGEVQSLRIPAEGLMRELERSFIRHQGREPRSLPGVYATYGVARERREPTPTPQTAGRWWVFDLPAACHVRVTRATDLTRSLRAAIMSHAQDPLPPALSGHGAPPGGRHVQWLALPMVGSVHSTGGIAALVLAAPTGLDERDQAVIEEGIARFVAAGARLSWVGGSTVIESVHESTSSWYDTRSTRRRSSERGYWARRSTVWRTVTPIALDRFPRAARRGTAARTLDLDDEVAQIIGRSCHDVGLPEPQAVQLVEGSPMAGVPPVVPGRGPRRGPARFGFYRSQSGQVRYSVHAQIRFSEPVGGPVVLGAGRHFGYGLLFPVFDVGDIRTGVRYAV